MNTGTKIFLAVFALFVGVLVLYYGVMTPPKDTGVPQLAVHDPAINAINEPQPMAGAPQSTATPVAPDRELGVEPVQPQVQPEVADASNQSGLPAALDPTRMLPLANVSSAALPGDLLASPPPVTPQGDAAYEATSTRSSSAAPEVQPQPDTVALKPPPISTIVERTVGTLRPNVGVTITPSNSSAARRHSAPQTTEYVVKSGDTMVTIARDWFGDETKWSLIAKANPWVDPARMQIGQKLQLPAKDAKPTGVKDQIAANTSVYIVRSGDSLAKIAREFYNNVAMWERIYEANRAAIGDDPAALQVGMKLTLPAKSN